MGSGPSASVSRPGLELGEGALTSSEGGCSPSPLKARSGPRRAAGPPSCPHTHPGEGSRRPCPCSPPRLQAHSSFPVGSSASCIEEKAAWQGVWQ